MYSNDHKAHEVQLSASPLCSCFLTHEHPSSLLVATLFRAGCLWSENTSVSPNHGRSGVFQPKHLKVPATGAFPEAINVDILMTLVPPAGGLPSPNSDHDT